MTGGLGMARTACLILMLAIMACDGPADRAADAASRAAGARITSRPDRGGPDTEGTASVTLGSVQVMDSPYVRLPRVPWVGHRDTWPAGAVGVDVRPVAGAPPPMWLRPELDHLRLAIRTPEEWRALWRGHSPGPAPATFPDEMLLVAGSVDRGRGVTVTVDSAVVARDTLFVVLGPHRLCPQGDGIVLSTGMMSYDLAIGRTPAFDGPVVFAEPDPCFNRP